MFFKKKSVVEDTQYHSINLRFLELETQIKLIKQDLERVEVHALESRKVYARKLKNLMKDEDKETDENNLKPSVFLGPDGKPL